MNPKEIAKLICENVNIVEDNVYDKIRNLTMNVSFREKSSIISMNRNSYGDGYRDGLNRRNFAVNTEPGQVYSDDCVAYAFWIF